MNYKNKVIGVVSLLLAVYVVFAYTPVGSAVAGGGFEANGKHVDCQVTADKNPFTGEEIKSAICNTGASCVYNNFALFGLFSSDEDLKLVVDGRTFAQRSVTLSDYGSDSTVGLSACVPKGATQATVELYNDAGELAASKVVTVQ